MNTMGKLVVNFDYGTQGLVGEWDGKTGGSDGYRGERWKSTSNDNKCF